MKNRDAKKLPKRAERQKEIAGKFAFHRFYRAWDRVTKLKVFSIFRRKK